MPNKYRKFLDKSEAPRKPDNKDVEKENLLPKAIETSPDTNRNGFFSTAGQIGIDFLNKVGETSNYFVPVIAADKFIAGFDNGSNLRGIYFDVAFDAGLLFVPMKHALNQYAKNPNNKNSIKLKKVLDSFFAAGYSPLFVLQAAAIVLMQLYDPQDNKELDITNLQFVVMMGLPALITFVVDLLIKVMASKFDKPWKDDTSRSRFIIEILKLFPNWVYDTSLLYEIPSIPLGFTSLSNEPLVRTGMFASAGFFALGTTYRSYQQWQPEDHAKIRNVVSGLLFIMWVLSQVYINSANGNAPIALTVVQSLVIALLVASGLRLVYSEVKNITATASSSNNNKNSEPREMLNTAERSVEDGDEPERDDMPNSP